MEVVIGAAIFASMAICANVCSRIAERKRRGAEEWFVCGVIFGPVAIVAVLLLPQLPERPQDGT